MTRDPERPITRPATSTHRSPRRDADYTHDVFQQNNHRVPHLQVLRGATHSRNRGAGRARRPSRGVSYAPAMTDRPVAALRRVRPGLRVRRAIAVLIVLVALAVGVDYGAAALTESAVSREMRSQLNLADDPSVRINN